MFLLIVYTILARFIPNANEKQRSWWLTLIVSFVLSFEGYFFVIPEILENVTNIKDFAFSESERSQFISVFFIDYCFSELLLAFSGNYTIQILEGLVHHVFYILFISIMKYLHYSNSFWIFSWCEIPTFLLAIQNIFNIRIPYFPTIFFIIRVALFAIVLMLFFIQLPFYLYLFTLPPALLILLIHSIWSFKLCTSKKKNLKLVSNP